MARPPKASIFALLYFDLAPASSSFFLRRRNQPCRAFGIRLSGLTAKSAGQAGSSGAKALEVLEGANKG